VRRPKRGYRVLKGGDSRVTRGPEDDWVNVQALEGIEGWKKGLLFTRTYAYQRHGVNGAQNLYRLDVTRLEGMKRITEAFGDTSDEVWAVAFADLKRKGVMPQHAAE
jgi:hypothetical protein